MWWRISKLYHGTNEDTAQFIREHGWDTHERSELGIGSINKDFSFFTKDKNKANNYAIDNLRHNKPSVIPVDFNGTLFKIPRNQKYNNDYGAWKYVCEYFNIPLLNQMLENGRMIQVFDMPAIISTLNKNHYDGIEFNDAYGHGKAIMIHNMSTIQSKNATH